MKSLHLIPYMHPSAGGPPVVADRFCRHLMEADVESEIVSSDSYALGNDDQWIEGYAAPYSMTILEHSGPKGFAYCSRLSSVLNQKIPQFDVVHIHNLWSYFNIVGSRLCRKYGVPYVVSSHGMMDPNSLARKSWKKNLYSRFVQWPQLRKAAGMIFTHEEEARLAADQCDGLAKGFVVPLAADDPPCEDRTRLAQEFLDAYPKFKNCRRVVFLGRLHSKKGLDLLLPAMKKVCNKVSDVEFLLIGPGEPDYLDGLERKVQSLGLAEKCHFLGSLQGTMKWSALAAADLFVLPSYQENFAIALVEALRVGTPAVISRRINIWEQLQQQNAVEIVELTDTSVAEKILRLLENEKQLAEAGNSAKQLAMTSFSWTRSAELLKSVYEGIV